MLTRRRLRLAAYAVITDAQGRLLLAREPGSPAAGPWMLPGGGVEYAEHPEDAVVREVREETGLQAEVGPLHVILSDLSTAGRRRRRLHNVRLVYRARLAAHHQSGLLPTACWCHEAEWRSLRLAPFTARALQACRADQD